MKYWIMILALCMSVSARAEILFQDPTGGALNAAFEELTEQEIKNISPPDMNRKKYLLSRLYLNGDKEFNVEQNCKKAVSLLTNTWEAGIIDSGYVLAVLSYRGVCVDKDMDRSRALATQAAKDGYILAQRMLGMAYVGEEWENLYPYNIDKGIYWLSKAGNAGDRESAGQLAHMYSEGKKVSQNEKKSFSWLKKGVFNKFEKGNMVGFRPLAKSYEKGIGIEIDLVKAYKYYDLYGTAGVEGKQRVAKRMTQEQIDEALRQSQAWQDEHNIQVGGGFIRRVE